jgi:hypothetical protein
VHLLAQTPEEVKKTLKMSYNKRKVYKEQKFRERQGLEYKTQNQPQRTHSKS